MAWTPLIMGCSFTLGSINLNEIGGDTNINLPKRYFELFFEIPEKLVIFLKVVHINKNAYKLVPVGYAGVLPDASNNLRFVRDGFELLPNCQERVGNQFVGDGLSVILPLGKRDLEPPL